MFENRYMPQSQDMEESITEYKDVVIIGNGPSGICLSYMLAGNWPYYTGEPHPGDEMLTARLANGGNDGLASSTRWGLESLSLGLEGRNGGKPLSLLMDHLQHPCTDAGLDLPPLLVWLPPGSQGKCEEHKVFDHVVLGKGPPGGAWQSMDPNVLTISLNRWMSLPGLDIRSWELIVEAEQREAIDNGSSTGLIGSNDQNQSQFFNHEKVSSSKGLGRVLVGTVGKYFRDYVRRQNIDKYFRCGTTVTSVRPETSSSNDDNDNEYKWIVEGVDNNKGNKFLYRAKRVVLATGASDHSNRLGLPGEDCRCKWLTHDLNDLEMKLDRIAMEQHCKDRLPDPVLIVGAGLSAADAVMAARFRGIPVLHLFRNNSNSEYNWESSEDKEGKGVASESSIWSGSNRLRSLPPSMYPEYHKVYEMMADGGRNYPLYKALPNHTLVDINVESNSKADNRKLVTLCAPNGETKPFHVSIVAILIGSRPDLSYFKDDGLGLGTDPNRPIDGRSNPILVDDFTYEVSRAPAKGLYALGPLAGDNFVRFIQGGAFGVLTHILNNTKYNTGQRAKKK